MIDSKDWKVQKLLYNVDKTQVHLIRNGTQLIVRKTLRLTNDNRSYAKYQLKLMKEIIHPHVVKYLDSIQEKDKLIVYMAYYSNKDLEHYLQNHQIDFNIKVRMFIDILSGMMELHSRYVIHRDLKLKNIFVDQNLRCVIGDLGIATKSIDSAKSAIGTITISPPEVYTDQFYNQKVDIWAVGIIGYQLFNKKRNGKIPFPFLSPAALRQKIMRNDNSVDYNSFMKFTKNITPMDEDIPKQIVQMIGCMLRNNAEQRLGWIQLYKNNYLQKYDINYKLCTFMAEYKMIQDTKQTLKQYLKFLKQQKQRFFYQLRYILHYERVQYFKQKYEKIRQNLIDIHIIHFKLMKKILDRYNYIYSKRIYNSILDWKQFSKLVKNQIHVIQHRINYKLRGQKQSQIRSNTKYLGNDYYQEKLELVKKILLEIDPIDLKDIKKQI